MSVRDYHRKDVDLCGGILTVILENVSIDALGEGERELVCAVTDAIKAYETKHSTASIESGKPVGAVDPHDGSSNVGPRA